MYLPVVDTLKLKGVG